MRLEFDEEYFRTRTGSSETSKMRIEKQKLFFHEVGHGLQLDHSANQEDVMYFDISGDKSFANYFNYVRSYLSDRAS
jgi:predicted Zn-dependent protease